MDNIMNKDDLCAYCTQIEMRYKSRLLPVLGTMLAIAAIVAALAMKEDEDISTALLTLGIVLLIVAVVKLFAPGKRLIYTPTGEVVVAKTYNHPQGLEDRVEHALASGNLELVKALAAKDGAPIVTVTYSTASGSFVAGQIFHYVPYEYEPLTKVYIQTIDRN